MGFNYIMHQFFFPGKWNMLETIDLTQELNKENENVVNSNTFHLEEQNPNGNKTKISLQSKSKTEG